MHQLGYSWSRSTVRYSLVLLKKSFFLLFFLSPKIVLFLYFSYFRVVSIFDADQNQVYPLRRHRLFSVS